MAKQIVENIDISGARLIWEPFCGGINVTERLVGTGLPVVASDKNKKLIVMYQALQQGWKPPTFVDEKVYYASRELPDTDPSKAFLMIGCAWGGHEDHGGFGRNGPGRAPIHIESARVLARQVSVCSRVRFAALDFLNVKPWREPGFVIFCDPPYRSIRKKNNTNCFGGFNSSAYWERVLEWKAFGARIYCTEWEPPPIAHRLVFKKTHSMNCIGGQEHSKRMQTDCMWEIL
jgi:hypothetical protein